MINHFHIKLKERRVEADNRKSLIVSLFAVLAYVIVIFAVVIYTQDLFKQWGIISNITNALILNITFK